MALYEKPLLMNLGQIMLGSLSGSGGGNCNNNGAGTNQGTCSGHGAGTNGGFCSSSGK